MCKLPKYVDVRASNNLYSMLWMEDPASLGRILEGPAAKLASFDSQRFGGEIPADAAFKMCWNCNEARVEIHDVRLR